jgi:hypothetical protein
LGGCCRLTVFKIVFIEVAGIHVPPFYDFRNTNYQLPDLGIPQSIVEVPGYAAVLWNRRIVSDALRKWSF